MNPSSELFIQIVEFEVDPSNQAAFVKAVASEVERWVQYRPGFKSATFHASRDGRYVLNYAQWQSEADFEAFTQDPECARLAAAIQAGKPLSGPKAVAYRVVCHLDHSDVGESNV